MNATTTVTDEQRAVRIAADEVINSIHPIQLTPSARIWKKLKTKHDGVVMVFQKRGQRNCFNKYSDVSLDEYVCYGSDAVIVNQVMGKKIDNETSSQKIEIAKVEFLACFNKVTQKALEQAGHKVYWINPADLINKQR